MSNISTVYDAMITRIAAKLTTHLRLPNPYKPNENSELFLKQGYGVALGPALNTNRLVACKLSIERQFFVSISRKYFALESSATNKASTEKQLLEDQLLLIQDFESDPTLNGSAFKTVYVSDNGIEYVFGEKDQFLIINSVFSIEYLEALN